MADVALMNRSLRLSSAWNLQDKVKLIPTWTERASPLQTLDPTGSVSGWYFLSGCQWWPLGSPSEESSGSWCRGRCEECAYLACFQLPDSKQMVATINTHTQWYIAKWSDARRICECEVTDPLEMVPQVCIHCVAEGECVQVRLRRESSYEEQVTNLYLWAHCISCKSSC